MSQLILAPFQLLELNVISAQDLAPTSRSMRTYAVAWVHPDRKLSTRVDASSHNNPTWNDKFVFRVDEDFLHDDTSAVMIKIYVLHWFKDVHVGAVRVLVGNLIQTPTRPHHHHPQVGMRFVALQVRRPLGRPQGILNIGVALLHSSMRSMPLYSQLSTSAIGYKTLMGKDDAPRSTKAHHTGSQMTTNSKPQLRRTKSDSSSMLGSELRDKEFKCKGKKGKASSVLNSSDISARKKKKGHGSKASSLVGGASYLIYKKGKKGKASSIVNVSGVCYRKGKASSLLSASDVGPPKNWKDQKGQPSSVLSTSDVGAGDPPKNDRSNNEKPVSSILSEVLNIGNIGNIGSSKTRIYRWKYRDIIDIVQKPVSSILRANEAEESSRKMRGSHKPSPKFHLVNNYGATPARKSALPAGKSPLQRLQSPHDAYATPRKSNLMPVPFITESELGPSPSEVAAAIANERMDQDNESSVVVGTWNEDDSVEGLQSKLERWLTELPPVYERGEFSSFKSSEMRHTRRHSEGSNGLFSCFSNICGIECSVVCGSSDKEKPRKKNGSKNGGQVHRSPSVGNLNYV